MAETEEELKKKLRDGSFGGNVRDLSIVFAVLSSQFDTIQKTQETQYSAFQKTIDSISQRLDRMGDDIRANYVSKEIYKPVQTGVADIIKIVMSAVIGAVLALVLKS